MKPTKAALLLFFGTQLHGCFLTNGSSLEPEKKPDMAKKTDLTPTPLPTVTVGVSATVENTAHERFAFALIHADKNRWQAGPVCNLIELSKGLYGTSLWCWENHTNQNVQKYVIAKSTHLGTDGFQTEVISKVVLKKETSKIALLFSSAFDVSLNASGLKLAQLGLDANHTVTGVGVPTWTFSDFVLHASPEGSLLLKQDGESHLVWGRGNNIHVLRKSGLVFSEASQNKELFLGFAGPAKSGTAYEKYKEISYPLIPWQDLCKFPAEIRSDFPLELKNLCNEVSADKI